MKQKLLMELIVPDGYEATGEFRPPNDELALVAGEAMRCTSPTPMIILRKAGEMSWWPEWLIANWIYLDDKTWRSTNYEPCYILPVSKWGTGWWGGVVVGDTLNSTEIDRAHVLFNPPDVSELVKAGRPVRFKNPRCTNPTQNATGIREQGYTAGNYGNRTGSQYDSDDYGSLYGQKTTPKTPSSAETSAASAISAALKDIKAGVVPPSSPTSDVKPQDPKTKDEAEEFLALAKSALESMSTKPDKAGQVITLQEDIDRIERRWGLNGKTSVTTEVSVPAVKPKKHGKKLSAAESRGSEPANVEEAQARITFLNAKLDAKIMSGSSGGHADQQIADWADEIDQLCEAWGLDWPTSSSDPEVGF